MRRPSSSSRRERLARRLFTPEALEDRRLMTAIGITVGLSDLTASEAPDNDGAFLAFYPDDEIGDDTLTVNYTVSGTATAGVRAVPESASTSDYTTLSGSFTIHGRTPAGITLDVID